MALIVKSRRFKSSSKEAVKIMQCEANYNTLYILLKYLRLQEEYLDLSD